MQKLPRVRPAYPFRYNRNDQQGVHRPTCTHNKPDLQKSHYYLFLHAFHLWAGQGILILGVLISLFNTLLNNSCDVGYSLSSMYNHACNSVVFWGNCITYYCICLPKAGNVCVCFPACRSVISPFSLCQWNQSEN